MIKVRFYDMLYFETPSNKLYDKQLLTGSLKASDAGCVSAPDGWRHKRRFLERHELLYVKTGVLHLTLSGSEHTVSAGELLVLSPYLTLEGSRPSPGAVLFYWAAFMTDQLELTRPLTRVRGAADSRPLYLLLEALCECVRRPDRGPLLDSLLLSVLRAAADPAEAESPWPAMEERVAAYLEEHLSEPITAAGLAQSLHYHKDYLNRLLLEHTGETLKARINRHKLDAARMLLRTSSYSVAEIGRMVGYPDANLFTKFFRYHQGVTPGRYRAGSY